MNICKAFAIRINNLLAEKQINLYKLEQLSGIPHGSMMCIMNGRNKDITMRTVCLLAQGFEMDVLDFLNDPILKNTFKEVE